MTSFSSGATAAPSFSFGGTTSTNNPFPAPGASQSTGFGFGTNNGTSTGTGSLGGFGSSAPAPSFGANPSSTAAASSAFGYTTSSAPAAGSGFGSAPSTTGFGFQSTPSQGGLFSSSAVGSSVGVGSAPTTAPFGFSGAPSPGSSFFPSTTNPVSAFGPPSAFGLSTLGGPHQPVHQQAPPITISSNMQYRDLPPQMKKYFDTMYESIMRHKRSMSNLQSMAPQLLLPINMAVGKAQSISTKSVIGEKLKRLDNQLQHLQSDLTLLLSCSQNRKESVENTVLQSIQYAKWPVEALAHRSGIRITNTPSALHEEKKEEHNIQDRVREMLDRAMASVDRIEKMPSPFLWQIIHDLEQRLQKFIEQANSLMMELDQFLKLKSDIKSGQDPLVCVTDIVEKQHRALWSLTAKVDSVRAGMERVRFRYRNVERGENVIDKAFIDAVARERRIEEEIQLQIIRAPPQAPSDSNTAPLSSHTPFSFPGEVPTRNAPTTPAPASITTPATAFSFTGAAPAATPTPGPSFGQQTGNFVTMPSTTNTAPPSFSTSATMTPSAKKKTARGFSGRRK